MYLFFFQSQKEFKNHSTSILAPASLIHFDCEDVTPEAVEALLADQDGVAWPIFVDGSRRSFQQARSGKLQLVQLWLLFTCIVAAICV